MADPVGLAGTIGTWMAVFMAIVALAGILPAYIIYKTSRTQRTRALSIVDDANGKYVSRGLRLPAAGRLFRTVQVPDLTTPPDIQKLKAALRLNELYQSRSTTSWVNFASLIQAHISELKPTSRADALEYDDNQCFLPVHRTWLVIIGLLHRYAFRKDYGLPHGVAPAADQASHDWKTTISGLSGIFISSSGLLASREEVCVYFKCTQLHT
jgi:hypothetical protein